MRRLRRERLRVAAEHCHARVEIQPVIRVNETLEQPTPDESGAAGNENVFAAQPVPALARGKIDNLIEIRCQRIHG